MEMLLQGADSLQAVGAAIAVLEVTRCFIMWYYILVQVREILEHDCHRIHRTQMLDADQI